MSGAIPFRIGESRSILAKTDLTKSKIIHRAWDKMANLFYSTPQRDFVTWMNMQGGKFDTTLIHSEKFKNAWYNVVDSLETARKCIRDSYTERQLLLAGIDWEQTLRMYFRDYADLVEQEGDIVDKAIVKVNRERIRMRLTIDDALANLDRAYGTAEYHIQRDHYRERLLTDRRWCNDMLKELILAKVKRTYSAIKILEFLKK